MKFKLHENLGGNEADLLRESGHDVKTTAEQNMCSASDHNLIEVCRAEERCLVTLDVDFGNPFLFKPSQYRGIALLRLGSKITAVALQAAVQTLIRGLNRESIDRKLWIVQPGRVRVYQEDWYEDDLPDPSRTP